MHWWQKLKSLFISSRGYLDSVTCSLILRFVIQNYTKERWMVSWTKCDNMWKVSRTSSLCGSSLVLSLIDVGAGQGPRDDFFVFFGDGCEEASLTRRLPLFLSSYYLVSLLSASLMFLAKFKIAKKFSCTSLLSKQEHTFKRCSVASTILEIRRITSS